MKIMGVAGSLFGMTATLGVTSRVLR